MNGVRPISECRLYAILDSAYLGGRDPGRVTFEMIQGGVDLIQVRAKDRREEEIAAWTREVLPVAHKASVGVIVNDHPEVAASVGADGVHVGQDDLSVRKARTIVGVGRWVGKSTHSMEQALRAEEEGPDYIGVGPVFATPTKPDYVPVGLPLVREVAARVKIPFFCIGGIKWENLDEVLRQGATRAVVVSGILQAVDAADYCRKLKSKLDRSALEWE